MFIQNHDVAHRCFLKAGDWDLLPLSYEDNDAGINLQVKTKRGLTFPAPIGVAPGLCKDGAGLDGLFTASGMNKDGLSTFIECGSCAPERQHSKKTFAPVIKINLAGNSV